LDPRVNLLRPGPDGQPSVAAQADQGRVCEVADPAAPLRHAPSPDAPLDTEALKGERVTVYETSDEGWAWGQLDADGYVGFVPAAALRDPGSPPTHKVSVLRTLVFPGPSIKLPPIEGLSLGCRLAVARDQPPFAVTSTGGYVPARHLVPIDSYENDFVAVAEQFVGAPYLWGGKSMFGIDCSGLVQVSLTAAGTGCPRDSDMQCDSLGNALSASEMQHLKRGDLIFWKGHVAIARDADTIVHANAHHMATVIEKTKEAIARIKAGDSDVLAIKRL